MLWINARSILIGWNYIPCLWSASAALVPCWCMHHPVALTHELAVEQLWIYCLMS